MATSPTAPLVSATILPGSALKTPRRKVPLHAPSRSGGGDDGVSLIDSILFSGFTPRHRLHPQGSSLALSVHPGTATLRKKASRLVPRRLIQDDSVVTLTLGSSPFAFLQEFEDRATPLETEDELRVRCSRLETQLEGEKRETERLRLECDDWKVKVDQKQVLIEALETERDSLKGRLEEEARKLSQLLTTGVFDDDEENDASAINSSLFTDPGEEFERQGGDNLLVGLLSKRHEAARRRT